MKKNNRGFTLIEMLGTIVLLGILGTVAIVAVTKYLTQSKDKAYRMMSQSVYEAAMNCATEGNCFFPGEYTTDTLKSNGYLGKLSNPYNKKSECTGKVAVCESRGSSTEYKNYIYSVKLKCGSMRNETMTWPEGSTKSCQFIYNSDDIIGDKGTSYPATAIASKYISFRNSLSTQDKHNLSNVLNSCNENDYDSYSFNISAQIENGLTIDYNTDVSKIMYYIGTDVVRNSGITVEKSGELGHSGHYSGLNFSFTFDCDNYTSGRLYVIIPRGLLTSDQLTQLVVDTGIDIP